MYRQYYRHNVCQFICVNIISNVLNMSRQFWTNIELLSTKNINTVALPNKDHPFYKIKMVFQGR